MSQIVQAVQTLIQVWSIDIYGGWSVMDIFGLMAALFVTGAIVNYFFFRAGTL